MSKKIPLTQGKFAIVDDEDYERVNQYKWCAFKSAYGVYYAMRFENKKNIPMHRFILGLGDKKILVDHIDCDGLNNTKSNLRESTHAQNGRNRGKQANNTSGYKGVFWNKGAKKWIPAIRVDKKMIALGCFDCKIEAAKAYNEAAIKYHGEFARLNEIPQI